jgi:uncharacterized protein (TIGR00251 family)
MLIQVRIKTGAKNESIIELDNKQLQIAVKESPENNAANRRVIELVARHYHVETRHVHITRGHTATSKHIEISD